MNLKDYNYNPEENKIIDVIWAKIKTVGSLIIPINEILFPTFIGGKKESIFIEDTPHFNYIKSLCTNFVDEISECKYRTYLETYFPKNVKTDMERLKKTIGYFKSFYDRSIPVVIVKPNKEDLYFTMYDGTHRTAIAKSIGHKYVQADIFNSIMEYR